MITNRIKDIRLQLNMTQSELALKIGFSRQSIHRIEKGITLPSIKVAYELADVLNTNLYELFIYNKTH